MFAPWASFSRLKECTPEQQFTPIPVSVFAEPVVRWLVRELRWQSANGRIVYFLSLCSSVRLLHFDLLWARSQNSVLSIWFVSQNWDDEDEKLVIGKQIAGSVDCAGFHSSPIGRACGSNRCKVSVCMPFIFLWSPACGVFCSCNPFVCTCGLFYQEIADLLCR